MSRIEAYLCDCCNRPVAYDDLYAGIVPVEDMFDRLASYPAVMTPDKIAAAAIHVCVECCRSKAIVPAGNMIDARKDAQGYRKKLKELMYSVRSQCVVNHRNRVRSKKR